MLLEKEKRIKIRSELYEVEASLFSELGLEDEEFDEELFEDNGTDGSADVIEINTHGELVDDGERISISYIEGEEEGMENSTTTITFLKATPEVVTMMRSGTVSTTLLFEEGKRYHCMYQTPFMPFEVCVHTIDVNNSILSDGALTLNYIVELRGAKAEHTRFSMKLL